jgi:hypothetical protein
MGDPLAVFFTLLLVAVLVGLVLLLLRQEPFRKLLQYWLYGNTRLESEETRRIVKQMDDLEKAVGKFFITLN